MSRRAGKRPRGGHRGGRAHDRLTSRNAARAGVTLRVRAESFAIRELGFLRRLPAGRPPVVVQPAGHPSGCPAAGAAARAPSTGVIRIGRPWPSRCSTSTNVASSSSSSPDRRHRVPALRPQTAWPRLHRNCSNYSTRLCRAQRHHSVVTAIPRAHLIEQPAVCLTDRLPRRGRVHHGQLGLSGTDRPFRRPARPPCRSGAAASPGAHAARGTTRHPGHRASHVRSSRIPAPTVRRGNMGAGEHRRRGWPGCAPRPRRGSWTPSARRTTSVSSPCTAAQPEERASPATSTSA